MVKRHPSPMTAGGEERHAHGRCVGAPPPQPGARVEQRVVQADGDVRQTVTRGEVVSDADGAVAGMRGTTQDVTEQRRAATAVVEARAALMRQTMELAEEHRVKESLQRAVLPARLPAVAGVELAARYLPADMPSLVGGDWYDAFCLPDGSLAVATGDVVGHDLEAAAMMGQVRNALRAYAFSDDRPAEVLARLNRLVTGLGDNGLATALFGRHRPRAAHVPLVVRWASAAAVDRRGRRPPPVLPDRSDAGCRPGGRLRRRAGGCRAGRPARALHGRPDRAAGP